MAPEGWRTVRFGDLAEFRNGINFSASRGGRRVRVVGVSDFSNYEIIDNDEILKVVDIGTELSPEDYLKEDDLLFVRSNGNKRLIGRCIQIKFRESVATFSGFTIRARVIDKGASADFIAFTAKSNEFLEAIHTFGGGTNISNLNQKILSDIRISLPPLKEQEKIVEVLSSWDLAIETIEKLVDISRTKIRAVTEALLPADKVLGKLNDDQWRFVRLGDVGATYGGLTGKSKDDFGSGKPYIPYRNVFENSNVDLDSLDYVRVEADEAQSLVASGDVIFTSSSETPQEVGMSSVVLGELEQLYLNSFCFGFRPFDKTTIVPEFARFFFRSAPVRRQIVNLAQGSTRYNLSKRQFLELSFALPPLAEQKNIAQILSDAQREEEILRDYSAHLRRERSALMQQLLTGKRRVKVEASV